MDDKNERVPSKYKSAVISIVLFFVIFIAGTAAFVFSLRNFQYNNAGKALSQAVKMEKLRIEAALNGEIALVLKMAGSPLVRRYFIDPENTEMEKLAFDELIEYRQIFILKSIFWANDIDRKLYLNGAHAYTVDPGNPDHYWYNITLYGSETFNFNINYDPNLGASNFWINAPVFSSSHTPIGIVGTGIGVSVFNDSIFRDYSGDASLYYFNNSGEITGANDAELVINKILLGTELGRTGDLIFLSRRNLEDGEVLYFNVSEGIAALASIPGFGWYVCAVLPLTLKDMLKTSMTILFAAMMLVVAGIIIIFNQRMSNLELYRERNIYKDMSAIDALTGIFNRRFLDENLERTIKSLSRSGGKLSVLMMDVDFFKKYNDTYGHNAGDLCLKTIANTLSQSLSRADDFVARYGGEEFVAVLPNTDENGAKIVAEKIIQNLQRQNIPHEKNEAADYVTISIGGASSFVDHTQTKEDYYKKSDEALYKSKQNGHNRYTAGN